MKDSDKMSLLNECAVLYGVNHPNIVKTFEYYEDERRYYLIVDNFAGTELF